MRVERNLNVERTHWQESIVSEEMLNRLNDRSLSAVLQRFLWCNCNKMNAELKIRRHVPLGR